MTAIPTVRQQSSIFISYRRSETAGYAGRISERLQKEFGQRRLFRDIETIKPGANFVAEIEKAVGSCSVLVALMGPGWAGVTDIAGRRRLDDPGDYVRIEIATALRRKIPVIPLLVGGAALPKADSVPAELKHLLEHEAHELSDKRWRYDLDQLIIHLKDILSPGWQRRRIALMTAAISLLLIGLTVGARYLIVHQPAPRIPRLALVNPTDSTGDGRFGYLSTEIADTLSASLALPSKLNVIPPDEVVRALEDISISPDQCSRKAVPGPLRDALGATYVIFGNFRLKNKQQSKKNDQQPRDVHVMLCLQDSYGNQLDKVEADTPIDMAQTFISKAAEHFRGTLGQAGVPVPDLGGIYPDNPDARRLYFEGLTKLRTFDARDAIGSLQQAAAHEDSNALIHLAMADAWAMLRHNEEAKREATTAVTRSNQPSPVPLPIEYREAIKARAAEINTDWEAAAGFYESLYHSYPERLDYGLKLASVYISWSKPESALDTLRLLTKLAPPLSQDPRIFLEQSKAMEAKGDYKGSVQAAETAAQMAEERKSHVLHATALLQLCWAHRELADVNSMSNCDKAQKIFEVFDDEVSGAVALNATAAWLSDRHRYDDAKVAYDRVIAVTEEAHAMSDLAGALLNSARVSILQGKPAVAEPLLQRSLLVSRDAHDKYDRVLVQINLAEIYREDGRVAESGKQAAEAVDLARLIGDRSLEAYALGALALAQCETGDLPGALQTYRASLKIRQDLEEQGEIAITWSRMGEVYLRMGMFADAEKAYRTALEGFKNPPRPNETAQTHLDLAELDLERGLFPDAEAEVATALPLFEKEDVDSQADSLSYLVRALVAEGNRLDAAEKHLKEMEDFKFSDPDVVLDCSLAEGVYLNATNNPGQALEILQAAADHAEKLGRWFGAMQLRLVAVEALDKSKNRPGAKEALAEVRASSRECRMILAPGQRCGFKLISDKAALLPHSLHP